MECDEKIGARIRQFMDDCNTFYEQGQLSKARDSLFEAWGILPDEKYIYDESYWIVAFILDLSIELHDMDVANQWADKILKCDLERQDDGDREMWVGKVLCESGETDEAGELLEVIKHTTNNVTPPPEACTTWKAMYNGINELIDDLMDHISLENNVLFPRALAGE